jgi:hypothetical protein
MNVMSCCFTCCFPYLHKQLQVHIVALGSGAVHLLATPAGDQVDALSRMTANDTTAYCAVGDDQSLPHATALAAPDSWVCVAPL